MGWFSNLFTNEVVSLAIADEGTPKLEPYAAVRTKITSGVVAQQINIIRSLILNLPVSEAVRQKHLGYSSSNYYGDHRAWPHRDKLCKLLRLLSTSLVEVDVARSDMRTLLHVINLCNETLPATFRELELRVGQGDWTTENQTLRKMEKDITGMLAEIAVLPTKRSILNLEAIDNNPQNKDFPNLETYRSNEELYASLKALQEDWDKAAALPLSAEDDYVIERVGNSYLPDALLLFDRFCHRTGSTNSGKAITIVKEQVSLIHQQVMFVLEQHEEDSFDLMETHTEFLKMKNSSIGIVKNKSLQLEEEPPETLS
jgi:hypothetical protein